MLIAEATVASKWDVSVRKNAQALGCSEFNPSSLYENFGFKPLMQHQHFSASLESLPKAFAMFPTATLLHEQQHGRRGLRGAAGLSSALISAQHSTFSFEDVLKNSSRELMCNSVLGQQTTDVGKVLLGEFCPMRTLPTSVLPSSSRSFCRCLEKVSIDFLLEHKHLGEEYLQPLSKMIEEGGADVGKEDLAHIGPTFFLEHFVGV